MTRIFSVVLMSAVIVSARPEGMAAAEPPDWTAVSAIFVERCVMCHASHGAALGLRLDTYDAAVAGSDKGSVLVSGDPGGSELLRRLRGDSVPRMPFLSYPLPPEQIDLIARWIEAGLPETRGIAMLPGPSATPVGDAIGTGQPQD